MNDNRQSSNDGFDLNPLIGFALGAVVGAAVALLMAPTSGEHTRRRLSTAARRWGNDAGQSFQEMRDSVTDKVTEVATGLGADAKSALDTGLDALRHDGDGHDARSASRVAQALKPAPPRGL